MRSTRPMSLAKITGVPNRTIAQRMRISTLPLHRCNNHGSSTQRKRLQCRQQSLRCPTCIQGTLRPTPARHWSRIQPRPGVCRGNIPVHSQLNTKKCRAQRPGLARTIGRRQFSRPVPTLSLSVPVQSRRILFINRCLRARQKKTSGMLEDDRLT